MSRIYVWGGVVFSWDCRPYVGQMFRPVPEPAWEKAGRLALRMPCEAPGYVCPSLVSDRTRCWPARHAKYPLAGIAIAPPEPPVTTFALGEV